MNSLPGSSLPTVYPESLLKGHLLILKFHNTNLTFFFEKSNFNNVVLLNI